MSHFVTAIFVGLIAMSLQHPTYKDIATQFNLTNRTNSSNLECIIGRMEMSVYDLNNNEVHPNQANLPYNANLTLGVMVQNLWGELENVVYAFKSDTNSSVVHESPTDNWATIKLKAGMKRQRFTVLVWARRTICQGHTVRCVGMDWIDFGTQSELTNGTVESDEQSNEISEHIHRNNMAFKLTCLQTSRGSNLRKSELSSELIVKSENITTEDNDDVEADYEDASNPVMLDLSCYLWSIVVIIAVLLIVFCIQVIGIKRATRVSSFDQQKLPNSIRDRIISGQGKCRFYKVSDGEKTSAALLAKMNSASNPPELGNENKTELDVFNSF